MIIMRVLWFWTEGDSASTKKLNVCHMGVKLSLQSDWVFGMLNVALHVHVYNSAELQTYNRTLTHCKVWPFWHSVGILHAKMSNIQAQMHDSFLQIKSLNNLLKYWLQNKKNVWMYPVKPMTQILFLIFSLAQPFLLTLCHIQSYHNEPHPIAQYCNVTYHIILYHIVMYHIVFYPIALYQI